MALDAMKFGVAVDKSDVYKLKPFEDAVNRVGDAADEVSARSGKAGKQSLDAMDKMQNSIGDMVTALGTVEGITALANKGVQLLREEYESLVQRQSAALGAQVGVQQAAAEATMQMPQAFGELRPMLHRVMNAPGVGMTEEELWAQQGEPLSAKGSLGNAAYERAWTLAAQAHTLSGGKVQAGKFQARVQDIMGMTGIDEVAAMGWIRQIGAASRVTEMQKQGAAITPVLSAAEEKGWGREEVAELWAYLTQRGKEEEGRISSTGAISFMGTLRQKKLIPTSEVDPRTGKTEVTWSRVQAPGMAGVRELGEAYRGTTEALQSEIVTRIGGEQKVSGALEGLLSESPEAMKALAQVQGAITGPEQTEVLHGFARRWFNKYAKGDFGKWAMQNLLVKKFKQEAEQMALGDEGATGAAVREGLEEWLVSAPFSAIQKKFLTYQQEWASEGGETAPVEALRDELQGRVESLQRREERYGVETGRGKWGSNWFERLAYGVLMPAPFSAIQKTFLTHQGDLSERESRQRDDMAALLASLDQWLVMVEQMEAGDYDPIGATRKAPKAARGHEQGQ